MAEGIQMRVGEPEKPADTTPPVETEETKTGVQVKLDADGNPIQTQKPEEQAAERPDWLPEKFKSPEDMAKAYAELESKQSKPEEKPAPTPEAATEAAKKAGVDMAALSAEYAEKGELSEATLKDLESKGFDRPTVDAYIEGQKALGAKMVAAASEAVGGEENLKATLAWAKANLSEEAIAAYDKTIDGGDLATIDLAVRGLYSQFVAAEGKAPTLVTGEQATGEKGAVAFTSTEQVRAAMSDPRYAKDAAYRKQVANRLAVSNVFG